MFLVYSESFCGSKEDFYLFWRGEYLSPSKINRPHPLLKKIVLKFNHSPFLKCSQRPLGAKPLYIDIMQRNLLSLLLFQLPLIILTSKPKLFLSSGNFLLKSHLIDLPVQKKVDKFFLKVYISFTFLKVYIYIQLYNKKPQDCIFKCILLVVVYIMILEPGQLIIT